MDDADSSNVPLNSNTSTPIVTDPNLNINASNSNINMSDPDLTVNSPNLHFTIPIAAVVEGAAIKGGIELSKHVPNVGAKVAVASATALNLSTVASFSVKVGAARKFIIIFSFILLFFNLLIIQIGFILILGSG